MTMKRMTMGELRSVLLESMALRSEEDRWVVTADMATMMGFDARRVKGSSDMVGYEVKGVWAPFQALKDMDAKGLSAATGRQVPEGVTANDMLEVLKTMRPKQTETGLILVPEPGLQAQVAQNAAAVTARRYRGQGINLVVTPQSSSKFAAMFGAQLAALLGPDVKHVDAGVIKSNKLKLNIPEKLKGTPSEKKLQQALDLWQRKHAEAETELDPEEKKKKVPSLRASFHPKDRQHVQNFMDVGDSMIPYVGEPLKVLLADDIATTGSTQGDSARALEEMGFQVVGRVAAFKEQPTPTKKKAA